MPKCKRCQSERNSKSGKINGKQRYKCKECGYQFTEGDGRTKDKIAAKKAMCVTLYSRGFTSFRMLAKIFNTSSATTYRWIVEAGCKLPDQAVLSDNTQKKSDEL